MGLLGRGKPLGERYSRKKKGEGKAGGEKIYCSSKLPHLIKLCLVHKQIYYLPDCFGSIGTLRLQ